MLWLKRNIHRNELIKCNVSGEIIFPGDFYYIDDVDGIIVKATIYKELKDQKTKENFDYSSINSAASEAEYKDMIKKYTSQILASTLLDRKIVGKYNPSPENEILNDVYSLEKDMINNGRY